MDKVCFNHTTEFYSEKKISYQKIQRDLKWVSISEIKHL